MKTNDLFAILSIIAIIIVIINISITYIKIADFEEKSTGKVLGYVNLSVSTFVALNMLQDAIDWGPGNINYSYLNSTLYTRGNNTGIVERGNWSGENATAFVVQNIGNSNCSLFIQSGKDAHDLFESASSTNEQYMINVSNKEANSCSGGANLGQWIDVNKTNGGTKYCSQFSSLQNNNEVYIDVLLTVPADSNKIGNLSDTFTITATAPD